MLVSPEVLASRNARLPEDNDPQETAEWLDAIEAVVKYGGADRAQFLLEALIGKIAKLGRARIPSGITAGWNEDTLPATGRSFLRLLRQHVGCLSVSA